MTQNLLPEIEKPWLRRRVCRTIEYADTNDDELRGRRRPDSDFERQPAERALGVGVEWIGKAHVVRFVRGRAKQSPIAPNTVEKATNTAGDDLSQGEIVRFEHREAETDAQRLLDERGQAADADVTETKIERSG